ncbi:MAG TPA: hypothetical protein PL029_10105 [Bacteroidia bacterium]|nr:hypothetical protein [Bacteroidia bacterium]
MKNIILSAALVLMSLAGIGQDNYTIKMNMKIEGLPAEYAAYGEQETVTYIKGEKNKLEVTSMMGSHTTSFDGKMYTVLIDQMGNKMGYTATKEEMDASNNKSEAKPKIEYTSEKKTIAGFECTKAIVTSVDKDKKEDQVTVWVTDKIKSDAKKRGRGVVNLGDLKGYPLEMQMKKMEQGAEMKITIAATEISTEPVPDATFVLSTEGYQMSSYKEAMEKAKAMGGGR